MVAVTREIRLAGRADLPRILDISNRAARDTTANFATADESLEDWTRSWEQTFTLHPWLVMVDAGIVVGFARSSPHRARGAYAWTAEVSVYIDPAHHGTGAGRALYDVLIPLLRAQGFGLLLAGITAGHEASERLHARFGFTRCGTFHRVGHKSGAWLDVGYWELFLDAGDPPAPVRPVAEVFGQL